MWLQFQRKVSEKEIRNYKKRSKCIVINTGVWCQLKCCSNHSPEWHLWYVDFSKALSRLSSSGDYKRTRQGAFAALLLYLYKYNVVRATTMCLPHVLLLIYHASTSRPLCYVHVPWHHTLLISTVHVHTMRNHSLLTSSLTLTLI